MSTGVTYVNGGTVPNESTSDGLSDYFLDDSYPWFVFTSDGEQQETLHPRETDGILHVALAAPLAATVSTILVTDVASRARGIRFRARASDGARLRVSVKPSGDPDFYAAQAAGYDWPVASVALTSGWSTFEVPLSEMKPPDVMLTPRMVAFVVEGDHTPVELWLDEVSFF